MIKYLHAHVYFDPKSRDIAVGVYERLATTFRLDSRWRDEPVPLDIDVLRRPDDEP